MSIVRIEQDGGILMPEEVAQSIGVVFARALDHSSGVLTRPATWAVGHLDLFFDVLRFVRRLVRGIVEFRST